MSDEIRISRSDCSSPKEIIGRLQPGKNYTIVICPDKLVYFLELEDALFRHNSAVFLPERASVEDTGTDQQEKVSGIPVLKEILTWAYSHERYKLLLAGHTDTSGSDDYNFKLSKYRAQSVLYLLIDQKGSWVDLVTAHNTDQDKQHILKWVAATRTWDCDPGEIDGKIGPQTKAAIRNFQTLSNISSDGIFGKQTWGAVYECYQSDLTECMSNNDEGKNALANRTSLNWAYSDPYRAVGCGELWPLAYVGQDGMRSQVNRRVEVLFFEEAVIPEFKCTDGKCSSGDCPIYQEGLYKRKHINQDYAPIEETQYLFHIHLDADRDGTVDDEWADNETWEFGEGKKGAIIRYNNDNDDNDAAKKMDFENTGVDQADDLPDIAQLELRKESSGTVFPAGWQMVLEVSDKTKIRIFDLYDVSGKEIIGPSKGKLHVFDDLSGDVVRLGMEALEFPGEAFDPPEIVLTLRVNDDKGISRYQEKAVVRVAPWIMFNHLHITDEVYVVQTADNAAFRRDLRTAIGSVPLREAPRNPYGSDRWMQDVMEIGFSTLPGTCTEKEWHLPVAVRTYNDRIKNGWGVLDRYPKNNLLGPGYGFHQTAKPGRGTSLDSFGNLECSPPVTVNGKEYKFGRIVYGEGSGLNRMHKSVTDFLHAQKIQSPFSIDTGWLVVGHVDETVSFCPMKNASKKFKVLAASPQVAVDILRDLENSGNGDAKLFQGVRDAKYKNGRMRPTSVYKLQTVSEILGDGDFMLHQDIAQIAIDLQKDTLAKELGLGTDDFIDLPVLFREDDGNGYIAYTAGVVNMLVVTHAGGARLCIPKPFGPMIGGICQFEVDIISKLGESGSSVTGLDYSFIDDFVTYHNLYGEIHCGTNSRRIAPDTVRWWEQES